MPINWKNISVKYKGKWLALKEDEVTVVGVGDTLSEALNSARKVGVDRPIMTKVPKETIAYIGNGLSI